MVIMKMLIGGEVEKMERKTLERATKQFVNFKVYDPTEREFPAYAHFYNPKGQKVTIGNYNGQYVLMNLWATWCPGCVKELPSLQNLGLYLQREKYPVTLIGLSLDREKTPVELAEFLARYDIAPFALYHDTDKSISKAYPVRGMPTTLLINPKGYVIYEFMGEADWMEPDLVKFLKEEIEGFKAFQEMKKSL
jgi:peroxiredoxin